MIEENQATPATLDDVVDRLDTLIRTALFNKALLNFEEALIYTGIARSTLYKLTSSRVIPHSKPFGKLIYFDRSELDDFLRQNRVKTGEEIEQEAANYSVSRKKPRGY